MKGSVYSKLKYKLSSPWIAGQLAIWFMVFLLSLISALLVTYSSLKTSSLTQMAYAMNGIALFAGGYTAGKKAGRKGWYFGGLQGCIYSLLLILIAFLGFDISVQSHAILFIGTAFLISAVGGILGVNLKK
ncbi:TIGR04086 family membrane protein [Thermoflavimicrobium dichotomicum]|uniref:Putative membrane protein, TIGR04086 family n=1 Tax=Thermoflavimicrobium dichotomicum TaxID=46223 RepID=A0A1I3R4R7_9BACL|nr:TIGR04086 family membrane protein [Thermoflavimicrobium dichotomicum]SFJ41020.1 putative membrane protein, TIGR04086 family [Thermoflavimicrobium dichotomicum]